MEHISRVLAGVAYALQQVNKEKNSVIKNERVFLPNLSSDDSNQVLTHIMNVVEKHTGFSGGWARACALAYLENPILEREEFRENLSEFFEIKQYPETPEFSHLVLTEEGKEMGKWVCFDRLTSMRKIASELLNKNADVRLVYISGE